MTRPRHDHAECARFLNGLLPAADVLIAELADDGWDRSDAAHERAGLPSPEQRVIELLGVALWDIFSDNHTVVDDAGVAYDLGSFRGSAGFIAESINRCYDGIHHAYDYMDFYMGSLGGRGGRMRSLHRWIFARLKQRGCRWIYAFPRLHVVDFGTPDADAAFTDYDPGRSLEEELERSRRQAELDELRRSLDAAYGEALEQARNRPLPAVVAAYREVFGELPEGWPHR